MSNDALYDQLLQKVLVENPELAQYAELFKQQSPSSGSSEDTEKRLRKVTSIAKRMKGDLDDALDRLDELAQALGACEECWGDNNRCPTCKGDGQPGFFKPDKELFEQYILPVLHKATWLEIKEK